VLCRTIAVGSVGGPNSAARECRESHFVLLHRGVSRCTSGRLHNKPRQNMFMNLIDKWRGFLIRIRCGLGGCNPKSRFRPLQVTPMTNMICSSILPTPQFR
jgi:hypothetical protein